MDSLTSTTNGMVVASSGVMFESVVVSKSPGSVHPSTLTDAQDGGKEEEDGGTDEGANAMIVDDVQSTRSSPGSDTRSTSTRSAATSLSTSSDTRSTPTQSSLRHEEPSAACGVANDDDNSCDDNMSDSTSLLSASSSSAHGSARGSSWDRRSASKGMPTPPLSTAPAGPRLEPTVDERPPTTALLQLPQQLTLVQQSKAMMEWATWAVIFGVVLFLCSCMGSMKGASFYLFRCSAWLCLSSGLVAFSSCPLDQEGNDADVWFSSNPQKRAFTGGFLALQSLVCAIRLSPHSNIVDTLIASWITCYGCIGRRLPVAPPRASLLLLYWFTFHHFAEAFHFMYVGAGPETLGAPPIESPYTTQLARTRWQLLCALTVLRHGWLQWQWHRYEITNGASGTSPTLALIYSFYGFLATASLCNCVLGAHFLGADNLPGVLLLGVCQGAPLLVVFAVGRVRLNKFLKFLERPLRNHKDSWRQKSHARWGCGKGTLSSIIASVCVAYYACVESSCANFDPKQGAGELVITLGGSAKGTEAGTRFLAPLRVNAGAPLATNGTVEARVLWVDDLCDHVLDCSSCPLALDSRFNVTTLRGKILLFTLRSSEEFFMCGLNRLGRTLGDTGLVGLGTASLSNGYFDTPGGFRSQYWRGEYRDAKPRDGDAGIPFPQFSVGQYAMSQFLLDSGINDGAEIRAVLTPTNPNPWRSTLCGYWKPLATLLMLGHVGVVEQAVSNIIGHLRMSGMRLDLAQLALANEMVAHCVMAVLHHDPWLAFHWGALPQGAAPAFLFGAIVLTCSSTVLLAAYWYVIMAQCCGIHYMAW